MEHGVSYIGIPKETLIPSLLNPNLILPFDGKESGEAAERIDRKTLKCYTYSQFHTNLS